MLKGKVTCQKRKYLFCYECFLFSLKKFSDKEELSRIMMGVLSNIAEVHSLRQYFMRSDYMLINSDLLDSASSNDIGVSYNAARVVSHIASDGPDAWKIRTPSRESVLNKMSEVINRWDINSQIGIMCRSLQPILHLVRVYETPECQQWAVWTLANLTKVCRK